MGKRILAGTLLLLALFLAIAGVAAADDGGCQMEVQGLPTGARVDIDHGPQDLGNGGTFAVTAGAGFRWRLEANGFNGPWRTGTGTCGGTLQVTSAEYCDMKIAGLPGGAKVDIDHGPQNMVNDDTVLLPQGIKVRWRVEANGFNGPWRDKSVDCSALTVTGAHFCDMQIQMSRDLERAGAKVDIDHGPQDLHKGDTVLLPQGINIRWRLDVAGSHSAWKTKKVDCTPLEAKCMVTLELPSDVWVQIYGMGWYKDGATIEVAPTKVYRYRTANANKYVKSPWRDEVFSAADCDKTWDVTPEFCDMGISLPAETWVQIYGVGWYKNGVSLRMPQGATVKYRAANANKYVKSAWDTKTVDCTPLAPTYCEMEIDIPEGTWVQIYGVGWYQDGAKLQMPGGATIKYRTANANKYVKSAWATKDIDCTPLAPAYCEMEIDIPEGTWVQIYGVGWYKDGAKLQMPDGATIRYRTANANKYVKSGWATKKIDCTPLKPAFCEMEVDIPAGTWVQIYGVGWYQDGAKLWMPGGATIKYRTANANKYVKSDWATKDIDCTSLAPSFCEMEVDIPEGMWVQIYGVGWYKNGVSLRMPGGATIKYRTASANKYVKSAWATKDIDCTPLAPAYCEMEIDIPEGTWVQIYGVGWYQDGAKLWMPGGATIKYRTANANKYVKSAWITKSIDCSPLVPAYCEMEVKLDPHAWDKVQVYGVGWFHDGDKVWMPTGATFKYRAYDVNGDRTGWQTKPVDCTPLVPECKINIKLPPDVHVDIYQVGWYQDGAELDVKPVVAYKYRLADATKKVVTDWKYISFSASECGGTWDLTCEFCHMKVNLGEADGWVDIYQVGWYQDGAQLWMPAGAKVKYRAANANKKVVTDWAYKTVDCTDLAPEFCHMKVNLGGSDGWVDIYQVDWYQDGAQIWMPVGAKFKYRAANANKKVVTDWTYKDVDCTDLAPEFCHMKVNLGGADGWVDIYQVNWYQDGAQIWMPVGAKFKYRAANANKKVVTDWTYKDVDCTDLAPEFCHMKVNLGGADGWVDIYQVNWYQDGSQIWMPVGAKFKYRAADATKKVVTDWAYKTVDCTDLAAPFCHVEVKLERHIWDKVDVYQVGYFKDGDKVWMPTGAKFKYRVFDANGAVTDWRYKDVDCTALVPLCQVTAKLPAGVHMYLENVGWFQDGDVIDVKPVKTYRYKLYDASKKVSTGWKNHAFSASDCGKTWDLTGEYCSMHVNLDGSDGHVYIENVAYFQHGVALWMPVGATFRYKAYDATKKVSTGWKSHTVDCNDLYPGFCHMPVDLDGGDGWVYIENVGWFQDGQVKWMPMGATFRYKAYDATQEVSTGWKSHKVDCGALKPGFCHMTVDLDGSDGWVYIENIAWFQDGQVKWMPTGATFRYKAYDSTQKVSTGWKDHTVDCNALHPGFCHMSVDLDGGDGWVYIENVGYFQHGDKKWMPSGASFRYKAQDSTQNVSTGWKTHQVDCNALKPGFCDMGVSLGDPYEWVYIENVGWFQDGASDWMPVGASFRFKACDANRQNCTGWQNKGVDCSALVYPVPG